MRRILRDVVPKGLGVRAKALIADLPHRLRDLPSDLRRSPSDSVLPVPPASLRFRVGANSSRQEFLRIGQECATDILAAYEDQVGVSADSASWLDFGCGCGRVARHLLESHHVKELTGTDIDEKLISWCQQELPGKWLLSQPDPPLPFPPASFDAIVSVSVFTHLTELGQLAWITEMHRVLRPQGLFMVSTHPLERAAHLPAPFALDPDEIQRGGFAHVASTGPFNHQSSFQSVEYLQRTWSEYFELRSFLPSGLAGYQDLSVWSALENDPTFAGSST